MPSGGYGINSEDRSMINNAMEDKDVRYYGLQLEWLYAYVTARGAGATPSQAAEAAYIEWDL